MQDKVVMDHADAGDKAVMDHADAGDNAVKDYADEGDLLVLDQVDELADAYGADQKLADELTNKQLKIHYINKELMQIK